MTGTCTHSIFCSFSPSSVGHAQPARAHSHPSHSQSSRTHLQEAKQSVSHRREYNASYLDDNSSCFQLALIAADYDHPRWNLRRHLMQEKVRSRARHIVLARLTTTTLFSCPRYCIRLIKAANLVLWKDTVSHVHKYRRVNRLEFRLCQWLSSKFAVLLDLLSETL